MSRDFDLISIDLETSGVDKDRHQILSVGCVRLSNMAEFYVEIRHESITVNPASIRINKIDLSTRDDKTLPTLEEADEQLASWLSQEGPDKKLIPLGKNIAAFDMLFLKKYLPKSAKMFGYRSLDLNALIFVDAIVRGLTFEETRKAAETIGKSYAEHRVPNLSSHNAMYDAWMNVGMLYFVIHDEWGKVGDFKWDGGNLD